MSASAARQTLRSEVQGVLKLTVDVNHAFAGASTAHAVGRPQYGGLCFGDSGGPVLYGTTILAVNSFVINANCAGAGFSYRIDQPQILSWINSFL